MLYIILKHVFHSIERILLHDNARPHVAQLTLQKLNELGYETLPYPPYSLDLSPTDSSIVTTSCTKNASKAQMILIGLQ